MARPSEYTPSKAEDICEMLADGMSLRKICAKDDMPDKSTVRRWLRTYPEFRAQYAQAREDQADHWADEVIDIADEAEDAGLAKIQVDARKWVACKLKPKAYGDRVLNEHTGKDGGPIETKATPDIELARRLAFLLDKAIEQLQSSTTYWRALRACQRMLVLSWKRRS